MIKKLFALLLLAAPLCTLADRYPRNFDIDIQHYAFRLVLSDAHDTLKGEAFITARIKSSAVRQLRLDLMNAAAQLQGKGMRVLAVRCGNTTLAYTHESNQLFITLPSVQAGETITVTVRYAGVPAAGLAIKVNRHGDRTFFSDNWPDLGHHWLPLVDHPYDKATCEFLVTAPNHYQVVSNGLLLESTNLAQHQKLTHWKQSVPIAPWLFVLGVADFAVQSVDSYHGKSIQTWVYRQDRDAGFYDFSTPTHDVLSFYSDYVGPFAYEKLANIQSNNSTGGMEAASAIMYSEKSVTGDRSDRWQKVIIHEIAHQWFGNAVTEADWDDVWLSEGFATYFTLLYLEHARGRDAFVEGLKQSAEQVKSYIEKNPTDPIVHNQLSDMSLVTSANTYQKGSWVLHMLRNLVGDVNFQKGIQQYYRKYFNSNATTADFRNEMEQASGQNLEPFFRQWLYQGGMPVIKGSWRWDARKKQVVVTLAQTQSLPFTVPVEIGVAKEGQLVPEIKSITLGSTSQTFSIDAAQKPARVLLDPRTVLLAKTEFTEAP